MIYLLIGFGSAAALAGVVLLVRALVLRLMERRFSAFQAEWFEQHYEEVQQIYINMRGWRHDYHNHIQTLKAYLTLDEIGEVKRYLDELEDDLRLVDMLVKSGNLMVDAIVNSKISLAASRRIPLDVTASVPENLPVRPVDLCVILGNLLDNAMEGCQTLADPSTRFLRLYMGVLRGNLYISVQNAVHGKPKRENGSYRSTKGRRGGFGLGRVDAVVARYHGTVNRQSEEGVFATEILLPLL